MKNLFIYLLLLLLCNTYAQENHHSKASKLFFFNNDFGALVKGNNSIGITNKGGQYWQHINLNTSENLHKILFTSETSGWIIGDKSIFKSTDGGSTWTNNYTFNMSGLYSLYFINGQNGFIGSQEEGSSSDESIIYYTNNSGESWNEASIDSNLNNAVLDFSFANDSVGVAVSAFTIYKTNNYGRNWNKLPINFFVGSGNPEKAAMIDDNNIILTASYPNVVAEGFLLKSSDGGLSWNRLGNEQDFKWGISDAFIFSKDSIWLTTGSTLYITQNGGNYWDTLSVNLDYFSFTSANEAYGLFDKYILYTQDGWRTYTIIDSTVTAVEENINIPQEFKLYQNYPNPFNPSTRIQYSISAQTQDINQSSLSQEVTLKVFDILGREVAVLVNEKQSPGKYEVQFDTANLPSGIYLYQLKTTRFSKVKKCILLK